MAGDRPTLRLDVALDEDAYAAELDDETAQLRDELMQLDVDRVERPVAGPAPAGARAADVAAVGTLLVKLGHETIGTVVRAIAAWVSRRRTRSVKLTLDGDSIELSNVTHEEQRRMLDAFLRHTVTR